MQVIDSLIAELSRLRDELRIDWEWRALIGPSSAKPGCCPAQ